MKIKCLNCNQIAVWNYMPSTSDGKRYHYCDNHVPRGCSCNKGYTTEEAPPEEGFKWIEENICWAFIDEKGRELPCIEFWYEKEGYEEQDYYK